MNQDTDVNQDTHHFNQHFSGIFGVRHHGIVQAGRQTAQWVDEFRGLVS